MGTPVRIIAALNGELAHDVKGIATDTLNTKRTYIRDTLSAVETHEFGDHKIMANESLSQQGKLADLKKLGTTETAPALKWIRPEITRLQEKEQRYRTQFFTVDSGIKELAERLPIFIYLWNKLDVLDVNARIKRFCQAAEADEVKIMASMLEHPEGPMVDEEIKERALTERAKRLFPQDYENFEQTQILLEFLTMIRDWLARWLALEVGVDLSVIRTTFGDEIADALTGIRSETNLQLTGASR